jgi:hypothetical protein
MTTYILDLEPLEDIGDTLVFEDSPTIFTEEYAYEFVETSMKLMYDYVKDKVNMKPCVIINN